MQIQMQLKLQGSAKPFLSNKLYLLNINVYFVQIFTLFLRKNMNTCNKVKKGIKRITNLKGPKQNKN